MADGTKIEWSEATWQIITGCTVLTPGCTNCYAMRLAGTRLKHHPTRKGLTKPTKTGPVWTGEVRFNEGLLDQPLRWRRPRMIFPVAHGDLFHENVPDEWIYKAVTVMALSQRHTYQVLTKRSKRMLEVMERLGESIAPLEAIARDMGHTFKFRGLDGNEHGTLAWPLSNVWLGFSAEDQERFDERWPHVEKLAWAGWLTWLSAEPLLGPINTNAGLWSFKPCPDCPSPDPLKGISDNCCREPELVPGLRWIVSGDESAQNKPGRTTDLDWHRQLRDDCDAASVPFFLKQRIIDGRMVKLPLLDGQIWKEFPEPRS